MITASVASIPEREPLLQAVLESIAPQVDRINLCLNGYPQLPSYLDSFGSMVEVMRGDNAKGCGEKFRWAEAIEGYHLVLDDDILYPSDYVERLVAWSQSYGDRAVVGVHGFRFRRFPMESYFGDRELFHFQSALAERQSCHVLGTGTILYHHQAFRFSYNQIESKNMSDLWFAAAAQRLRVPFVAIARDENWVRSNPLLKARGMQTIFRRSLADPQPITELANAHTWNLYQPSGAGFAKGAAYWQQRYAAGATSGAGSRGRLASYKAEFVNRFVAERGIERVIEFGCGDGEQLAMFNLLDYSGFDVSATAIERCNERFTGDDRKRFALMSSYRGERASLVLSLDVLYHLVDDQEFERYLRNLFAAASHFVIVYTSDWDEAQDPRAPHVRHRAIRDWIGKNVKGWRIIAAPPHPFPFAGDYANESFASFFVYERLQSA